MTDQKQKKRLSRLILFWGGLLLAASLAHAEPEALDDHVLDRITAGTANAGASGGVIVGNSSTANISRSADLDLSGEVQMQAKGLNLVNSNESAVANGVNVWHGGGLSGQELTPVWAVNQVNHIEQEQRRSAAMSGYSRPEMNTLVRVERSAVESHDSHLDQSDSVTDLHTNKRIANSDSSGAVDTLITFKVGDELRLDANIGNGMTVAGQLDTTFDAGSIEVAMAAGAGISAEPSLNIGDFFKAGVEVSASADLSLNLNIELPVMKLKINGAGCGALMGSCNASGTQEETTEEIVDKSSLQTMVRSETGESHHSEVQTIVYSSPFELNNARAEYIVMDGASLVLDSNVTLALSGSAQREVRGMNVVNAIGSTVANGVNVARNAHIDGGGQLVLNQSNVITHNR